MGEVGGATAVSLARRVEPERRVQPAEAGRRVESGTDRAEEGEQTDGTPTGAERADGDDGQQGGEQGTGEAIDPADVAIWHTNPDGDGPPKPTDCGEPGVPGTPIVPERLAIRRRRGRGQSAAPTSVRTMARSFRSRTERWPRSG